MYNKLFTKILDSSIWLEPDATRLVWMTLIAAMDEDGFVQFASVANLAHRARVSLAAAKRAVTALESPDENSSDPDHEGRRIERAGGGWMILNAAKYRELVTRTISREQTRLRVARHREKNKSRNAGVTVDNVLVTPSEADTKAEAEGVPPEEHSPRKAKPRVEKMTDAEFVSKLKTNPAYKGIDIDTQIGKMEAWLMTPRGKGRKLSRQFMVNWLNKVETPMESNGASVTPKPPTPDPDGWREWLASKEFDYVPHAKAMPHWKEAYELAPFARS